MNVRRDSPRLVSSTVPFGIQENATFIVDLDTPFKPERFVL